MERKLRTFLSIAMAAVMLFALSGAGLAASESPEPEILSLGTSSKIQSLVFGCAAVIPVYAEVSPEAAGLDVYAALYAGERMISEEVKLSNGAATIRIGSLGESDDVYIGARFAGAEVSKRLPIAVRMITPSIWTPVAYTNPERTITNIHFTEEIAPAGAYLAKANGAPVAILGSSDAFITVDAPPSGTVSVSKVKYPKLFPSYCFTFTFDVFVDAPVFHGADAPKDVYTGQNFAVIVRTNLATLDVGLFETMDNSRQRIETSSVYSDVDGVRTWVLTVHLSEAGVYEFHPNMVDAFGVWWATEHLSITATDENAPAPVARTLPTRATQHDPSILKDPNAETPTWYIIGTGTGMPSSTDLVNWTSGSFTVPNRTTNLAESFAWAGLDGTNGGANGTTYASGIVWNPYYDNGDGTSGAYMWYYCSTSNFKRGAIGFAVSKSIRGPYNHVKTISYSGFTLVGGPDEEKATVDTIWTNTNIDELIAAGVIKGDGPNGDKPKAEWFNAEGGYNSVEYPENIDPEAFFDKDGKFWMIYGAHNGGIFMLELDKGTGLPRYPGVDGVTEGGNQIDRYFGIRIAGGFYRGGEGGHIVYNPTTEYYYLQTVYGQITGGYNLRMFRSKNVTGPYLDAVGNRADFASGADLTEEHGIKLIGNYSLSTLVNSTSGARGGGYKYAGHGSYLMDNGQMYIFYHQRFVSGSSNQIRGHQMFPNEDGWPVTAVFENTNDTISPTGYAVDDIVGTYEFVNHGSQTSTAMLDTLIIDLNADGTVTGDIEGAWSMNEGTHYMSMTINGVVYKGVFFKQQDESLTVSKVMTFSAVGTNNECIWGARMALSDSDLKAVNASAALLTLPYGNTAATAATTDIPLFNEFAYGTRVVWTTSDPAVISADGTVTRGAEDVTVNLTAVIIRGNAVTAKAFSVLVKAATAGAEAFTLPPLYNYGFSTADGYLTMNTGSLLGIGTLVGGAKVVNDENKGPVLETTRMLQWLELPSDSLKGIQNGFTVSMWVNPVAGFDGQLFAIGNNDWFIGANYSLCCAKGIESDIDIVKDWADNYLPTGEWSFVTFTVNKSGIALYRNGNLVASGAGDLTELFSDNNLSDMYFSVGGGPGTVRIDDVKIYGIPMSASQVASLIDPDIAWQTSWRIDFGPEGSPLEGGFVAMSNLNVYKKIPLIQCFGFSEGVYANESAEGGNKFRDHVYMPGGEKYSFYMDLPNGTYNVYVYTGAKDSANTTHFTIQDDPTVYTHETPLGVGSDNHGPLAALRNFTVVVTDNLLKMTFWGDETLGADAITGRLGSLEITRLS